MLPNDYVCEGQMSVFDIFNLDSQFGKMSPEHSVQTTEKTSELYWKNLSASKNRVLQFLDLKTTKEGIPSGLPLDTSKVMNGVLLGECLMLNIGESPNEERESHLSWILMEDAPQKYFLSPKACLGILKRASKRGKVLPGPLRDALLNVIKKSIDESQYHLLDEYLPIKTVDADSFNGIYVDEPDPTDENFQTDRESQ